MSDENRTTAAERASAAPPPPRAETITDATGHTTEITCNSFGQPLTITNAKNETTTLTYETGRRIC